MGCLSDGYYELLRSFVRSFDLQLTSMSESLQILIIPRIISHVFLYDHESPFKRLWRIPEEKSENTNRQQMTGQFFSPIVENIANIVVIYKVRNCPVRNDRKYPDTIKKLLKFSFINQMRLLIPTDKRL